MALVVEIQVDRFNAMIMGPKWHLQGVISQTNCGNHFIFNTYTIASRVSSYLS